jgi:hypothetical protein
MQADGVSKSKDTLTHPSNEHELMCAVYTAENEHSTDSLTFILQFRNPQQRQNINVRLNYFSMKTKRKIPHKHICQ